MNKVIIYHHRTRSKGAEGVHIRGVKGGFVDKGYLVEDISFVSDDHAGCISKNRRVGYKQFFYNFIADYLPNGLFKFAELLYPLRAYIVSSVTVAKLRKKKLYPGFIYERYAYFSFGVVLFSKRSKIPLILEVNTTCLDNDVRKIKFRYIAKKIEKFCFFQADLIIVVSGYLKQKIIDSYGVSQAKILVLPNAVDPKQFIVDNVAEHQLNGITSARSFAREKIIIGFVGVFVPWHGLDLLIDVFGRLVNKNGGCGNLGLILVGDGPTRPLVEALLSEKKMLDKVFITGMVSHSDIKYLINLFDIAVMPDSNPFGSPMKIFEYMVMGKAVIAPDYSPIEEVVTNGRNGIIFKKKDAVDLVGKLEMLIKDPLYCKKLGDQAKIDALEYHTWEKNTDEMLKKLKKI